MTTAVSVKGLSELLRDLRTLPARIERNVIRGALRAGGRVLVRELAKRTPVGRPRKNWRGEFRPGGDLLKSIKMRVTARKGAPEMTISIGSRLAWYANIVERGTYRQPGGYWIVARKAKALRIGHVLRRRIWHPGISPRYFVRDAFAAGAEPSVQEFRQYVARRLPRELVKQQGG